VAFTAVRGGGLGGGRNLLPLKMRIGPSIRGTGFEREGKRNGGRRAQRDGTNWMEGQASREVEKATVVDGALGSPDELPQLQF
jgi:hypothetical protein